MAPVILELKKRPCFDVKVCVTAQHREMLDMMLKAFGIEPDIDLNIMRSGQTLFDITSRALNGLGEAFAVEKPDMVLVHGDTATTFSAALAAFYSSVKLGHVEAGLRTFDKYQPYPEEMNRKLTAGLADINFAPTGLAKANLLAENIPEESIFVTGNTAIDAVSYTVSPGDYAFEEEALNGVDFSGKKVILMTAHRRENLGAPLENIFRAAKRLLDGDNDLFLIYPVHLNPLVSEPARRILGGHGRVLLTNPVGLKDMHNLISRSFLIMTDSGGLQEEAPALRKPVVVLRNVTERPEGIAAGTLKLAGTEEREVYETAAEIIGDKAEYNAMAGAKNPFGDGRASERIADALEYYFGINGKRPEDFS